MIRLVRYGVGLCILWFTMSGVGYAQDPAIVDIFKDGFYGGLAGALVGGAALLFDVDDAKDHLNYIAIGAGIGVIAGTAYGIYAATQALAVVQGTRVTWNLPMLQMTRRDLSISGQKGYPEYSLAVLRVHF